MKTQEKAVHPDPITREEYDEIREVVSELSAWMDDNFPNRLKKCLRYAASMIPYYDSGKPIDDIMNDTLDETLLIDLVETIARIRKRHITDIDLPEYEALTRKPEKVDLTDLTSQEMADVRRWRTLNRLTDLLGDAKQMRQHRRILKEAFATLKDEAAMKTWEALDLQLDADIQYTESLTANVE